MFTILKLVYVADLSNNLGTTIDRCIARDRGKVAINFLLRFSYLIFKRKKLR